MPAAPGLRVWIDIDNPAQVQYQLRFQTAFVRSGAEVLITARAFGMTADLISGQGSEARIVGGGLPRSKLRKAVGTVGRARGLAAVCKAWGRPAAVISTSRATALASWWMGINQFALLDYEHVDLAVYRQTGCHVLHPDIIPVEFFLKRGFKRSRLLPFRGLKEDISFSAVELASLQPETQRGQVTRFLVRPPAEQSHYYVSESGKVTREVLGFLSARSDAQVLFSPRHPWQRSYLEGQHWVLDPVLLDEAVPFPELLSRADAVVSAGGTMLREAAYLGIPGFSTFRGVPGAVDLHLETQGRVIFMRSIQDFDRLLPAALVRRPPMESHPGLLDDLVRRITAASSQPRPRLPVADRN
jgi:uncharacterized protein